jgi:hypothetical protein
MMTKTMRATAVLFVLVLLALQASCLHVCVPCRCGCGGESPECAKKKGGDDLEIDVVTPQTAMDKRLSIRIGMIWYLLNEIERFHYEAVEGGPIMATERKPGTTLILDNTATQSEREWYFISGEYMFVKADSSPGATIATVPGQKIVSGNDWVDPIARAAQKWVTMKLLTLYDLDPTKLHVPILTGEGWNPAGAGVEGATQAEAADILGHLGLTASFVGSGRVSATNPTGGTIATPGSTVNVQLSPDPTPIQVRGDTPATAIPIAAPGDHTGEITILHTDALGASASPYGVCFGQGEDVFFRLPASAIGRDVSVEERTLDLVVLSAWERDPTTGAWIVLDSLYGPGPACDRARGTSLGLTAEAALIGFRPTDASKEYYVVVEHQTRDTAMFILDVRW